MTQTGKSAQNERRGERGKHAKKGPGGRIPEHKFIRLKQAILAWLASAPEDALWPGHEAFCRMVGGCGAQLSSRAVRELVQTHQIERVSIGHCFGIRLPDGVWHRGPLTDPNTDFDALAVKIAAAQAGQPLQGVEAKARPEPPVPDFSRHNITPKRRNIMALSAQERMQR